MKVQVTIMLKSGVLDPQGRATQQSLHHLGFTAVQAVRQGKVIELEVADGTSDADVKDMCEKLLANTVIESYRIEMNKAA
jgi:phosphoribosylformylglycinamidine synthase subunit PurS